MIEILNQLTGYNNDYLLKNFKNSFTFQEIIISDTFLVEDKINFSMHSLDSYGLLSEILKVINNYSAVFK